MKHNVTMYDILLSCPGDAYNLCYPAVEAAIKKFNSDSIISKSISLSLKHWSTSSYPQSGGRPQKLLNSQIVDNADIAIAIFWTRFGTPTDDFESGTEEEISRLIEKGRQVFLYFLDKPIPPSLTDLPGYSENRKKVIELMHKYEGLYDVVHNENELESKIVDHLRLYFSNARPKPENTATHWYHTDTGQEILPTQLLKCGNTVAQIDGTTARVEVSRPDGKTVYAEVDTKRNAVGNIAIEGYPQEYVLDVPKNIIIGKRTGKALVDGITYRAEHYILKFNGHVTAIYDLDTNELQDVDIQAPLGMTVIIDVENQKIRIVKVNNSN